MKTIYDTIIIGGGPGGVAAGVYAARKKLKTLLITESFGGQSVVSDSIENWLGEIKISGIELARKLESHLRAQKDVDIIVGKKVEIINVAPDGYEVISFNNSFFGRTIIIASGGRHRHLRVLGEKELIGKGVAYCSTCDAPFFRNKIVAVIGGGNSGLEAVLDLKSYAKKIYLINNTEIPTGDPLTLSEIKKIKKVEIINNSTVKEIFGKNSVKEIAIINLLTRQENNLEVDGVFVEIGSIPNTEFVGNLVKRNKYNEIIVDYKTAATSRPGIFAAGDVTDDLYKQNNIAVGDAIRAALSAYYYILNIKKRSKATDYHLANAYRAKE